MKNKKIFLVQTGALLISGMMVASVTGITSEARFGYGFQQWYESLGGQHWAGNKNPMSNSGAMNVNDMATELLNDKYFKPNTKIKVGDGTIIQTIKEQNTGSETRYELSKQGYVYKDGKKVNGLENIIKIAVGSAGNGDGGTAHLIALKNDGTVWVTGNNTNGQLGLGWKKSTELNREQLYDSRYEYKLPCKDCSPNVDDKNGKLKRMEYHSEQCGTIVQEVVKLESISNAIDVAATYYSTAILTKDGSVYTFGHNRNYELGVGKVEFKGPYNEFEYDSFCSYEPRKTKLTNITKIAGETFTFVAEDNTGTEYAWGAVDTKSQYEIKDIHAETPKVIKQGNKKPETKPETKPVIKPEIAPETKPETIPETTPETKPETIPETTPETKPETIPESTIINNKQIKLTQSGKYELLLGDSMKVIIDVDLENNSMKFEYVNLK